MQIQTTGMYICNFITSLKILPLVAISLIKLGKKSFWGFLFDLKITFVLRKRFKNEVLNINEVTQVQ